jgi:hypothetical protein
MKDFKNLKLTVHLKSEAIMDRFLSIDSILLYEHYKLQRKLGNIAKDVFIETKDDLENLSKWISAEYGSVSGSIWYVADDAFISLWNTPVRKTTKAMDIYRMTGRAVTSESKRTPSSGEFKTFDLAFETIKVDKIHFYVRGDKAYIEKLCQNISSVGKKSSIGFGWVDNVEIEVIKEDKSFMLDEHTVSKPLACSQIEIDSHKVAFYRTLPPYHSKEGQEACYMPTTAWVETSDNSRNNKQFKSLKDFSFISNTHFLHNALEDSTKFNFDSFVAKKGYLKFDREESQGACGACGAETKKGIVGDLKKYFSATFNDFPEISTSSVLCEHCMWSTQSDSEKAIGFTLAHKNKVLYVQGGKMEVFSEKKTENSKLQSQYRKDLIYSLDAQKVPFSINWKTTTNTQHVGFKGKVSISNAMQVFNYGDSGTEFVDIELLNQALKDMVQIMEESSTNKKKNNGFKKTHLLNVQDYKGNVAVNSDLNTLKNRQILSGFYKKYDSSIRKVLHKVVF